MILLQKYSVLLCILVFFAGCEKGRGPVLVQQTLNERYNFNELDYREYLGNSFNTADINIRYADPLKVFYQDRNYHPLFLKSFEEEDLFYSIINKLSKADEHGINPEVYKVSLIMDEYSKIIDTTYKGNRYIHLANTERLLGDAVLNYSYHLRYGLVNPKEIFPDSYFLPVPDSSQKDLLEPLFADNIINYLDEIQPVSEKYIRLQEALKQFKGFEELEWTPIYFSKRKLEVGSHDHNVPLILERLIAFDLIDTSVHKIDDIELYDSTIAAAVKEFQKMHGLNADGVIGGSTLQRLNYAPQEYISKIKISLERFRWLDYSNTPRYILVNIPDFNLYVIENREVKFNSKVCTGLRRGPNFDAQQALYKKTKNWKYRPDDWETPAMYGEISHMVLNPTWTVPVNIIREEIAREVRNDTTYLERKNFRIYKDGFEVAAASVRPQELISGTNSFRIVQGPGSLNALGKIKFMFNNPFGIYLHDTPTRPPFGLDNRAVSHGCVRVEKPLGLSEYLLEYQSKWNIDYLKLEVGSRVDDQYINAEFREKRSELRRNTSYGMSTDVKLDKKVPLYIDYYTAWVDDDGNINFRDDVYRKDKKLLDYKIAGF
jgi:L,D-transpeptidase YcbB